MKKEASAIQYISDTLGFQPDVLLKFPKYFLIETINICNARCIMCGIDFDSKKKGVMDDILFEKIITEIGKYRNHVEKVMLYLDGEPLLDKKLPQRIRMVKDAGIKKVNIATNASLLDERRAVAIIEAGLDDIYITIDSMDKETFQNIRRGLKFETVHQNILDFIRVRDLLNPCLMIRVQMVLQELNRNEADTFLKYWSAKLGPQDQAVVQKAHNWASTVEVPAFGDEDVANHIPCIALWGTFVVHINGDVPLCCMDSRNKVLLGNLEEQSIVELWKSDRLNAIRKKHLMDKRTDIPICDGCTLWREAKRDVVTPKGIEEK